MKKLYVILLFLFFTLSLSACTTLKYYTVTFDSNGGSHVSAMTQLYNTNVTAPTVPTKEGYTFGGWYSDSNLTTPYSFTTMPDENITLYAKWNINQYTLSFDSNGGASVPSITQNFNTAIVSPKAPTKEGYTFEGWYSDFNLTTPYTFTTMPSENTTLYAKWSVNDYTITFDSNGGSVVSQIAGDYNTLVTAPATPAKEGYIFDGWYSDSGLTTPYTFTTMPSENTTLYAKWSVNEYTITFDSNGGSVVAQIAGDYNTPVTAPATPAKEGYTFEGWYSDFNLTTPYTFSTMPSENTTLYAKWSVNDYTITFNSNGGSVVAQITENYNTSVTAPATPAKEGYTFDGWYSDSGLTTPYTFSTMPSENTTLYAKWSVNDYTITFDSNGGSVVAQLAGDYNTPVTAPATPAKEGYTFDGWYSDSGLTTPYTFSTMPSENTTLYAKWVFAPTADLTYQLSSDGNSYIVTGYSGDDTVVAIPKLYNGLPVSEIGANAFMDTDITSVIFEENSELTSIGSQAFALDTSLTNITLPDGLLSIGQGAFNYTSITDISIPSSVTTIGQSAFSYSTVQTVTFEAGSQLTEIPISCFYGDANLTAITMPSNITSIDAYAFYSTARLISITIPKSVTSIGNYAFDSGGFSNLKSVTFEDGSQLTTLGMNVFCGDYGITQITLPYGLTTIGSDDFSFNQNLSSITIPDTVTSIGLGAFRFDPALTTITIPASVTSIPLYAFENDSSLTTVIIPDGVTFIGDYSFQNDTSLTTITIPGTVNSIGSSIFTGCTDLESVIVNSTTPPSFNGSLFDDGSNVKIYVPNDFADTYKTDMLWSIYADNIYPIDDLNQ